MAPKPETKHIASVSFTSLALNLSMLIVGAEYNSEEHCKLEASEYMTNSIYRIVASRSTSRLVTPHVTN